ncbi:MAG: hypothetical protein AAGL89_03815 [Pseudomonadota bacterium]
MDQSFADRLARIQSTSESIAVPGGAQADLIGTTGTPDVMTPYPVQTPQTYEQRFRMAIINNLILGAIWMAITAYLAANFPSVVKGFVGAEATAEDVTNMRVGLGVALAVSGGLFWWVVREAIRDLGKAHGMPASLAVGGVIGIILGAGPTAVMQMLTDMGYF